MLQNLYHIFRNECPHCHKGKVFADKSFFFSVGFPKMNEYCSHCNTKFEPEPGYFYGAMFVCYGLTVGQGILTYLIASIFFEKAFDPKIIPIIVGVVVTLCFFNIRLSRMIWIYMFRNYSM